MAFLVIYTKQYMVHKKTLQSSSKGGFKLYKIKAISSSRDQFQCFELHPEFSPIPLTASGSFR